MPRTTAKYVAPPGKKWCPQCERYRVKVDHFAPREKRADGYDGYCMDCRRAYDKKRGKRSRKPEYRKIRDRLLDGYGGKCVECGEADYTTLMLECLASRRPELRGIPLYTYLIMRNFPRGWKLYCRNCLAKKKAGRL